MNCEQLIKPETISAVVSILFFVSESLPFIKSIKPNGRVDAIHLYIFNRND